MKLKPDQKRTEVRRGTDGGDGAVTATIADHATTVADEGGMAMAAGRRGRRATALGTTVLVGATAAIVTVTGAAIEMTGGIATTAETKTGAGTEMKREREECNLCAEYECAD